MIGAIRRGLAAAGLPVEYSKGEAGRGQHEINLTFQDAVEMADINMVFKNAVKEIAAVHGVSATFMAKPHFDDAGSSFHIHSSLWSPDSSTSAMPGDGEHHMSDVFRWYLGGLLATAAEFSLLVAPTVNSYKRFLPGSWAPTGIGWGVDNRTLGFRVVGHGEGLRVENRIPGADANTYHAFAATIAGGLYGLANKIDPPPAYEGRRLHGDRPAAHPGDVRRGDRAVAQQRDRQGVLRRRRPPPRAALRRDGVGGVQPHRHRLGAAQILRT